ncbi:bacillithiol biosynthesis deacetylase BshB1 [Chryseobacterium sp. SORGH_AS 447]|nr:bacillithiol biosynthesis deacetylase BshB1 [Chryseobacterium sp. SORGH_AS_0447]
MKTDILAFGAHPDDVELGCGGTIAKMVSEGKTCVIVDLTKGELGTRGTEETRKAEAADSAGILGVAARENLGMKDGFLENSEEYQMRIVKMVRKYRPEIVLANAIDDRHPDHAKGAKLVSDACFLAGLRKIETLLDGENQEVWRDRSIFSITFSGKILSRNSALTFPSILIKKLQPAWLSKHSSMIRLQMNRKHRLLQKTFMKA